MPECICVTRCVAPNGRRYNPGQRDYFEKVPKHFKTQQELDDENLERMKRQPETEIDVLKKQLDESNAEIAELQKKLAFSEQQLDAARKANNKTGTTKAPPAKADPPKDK